jgi:hypothetical protein
MRVNHYEIKKPQKRKYTPRNPNPSNIFECYDSLCRKLYSSKIALNKHIR